MALTDISAADLKVFLRLQRDDFERLATLKRQRNDGVSDDHDTAMKFWASELDSVDTDPRPRKRFREIWSSDKPATSLATSSATEATFTKSTATQEAPPVVNGAAQSSAALPEAQFSELRIAPPTIPAVQNPPLPRIPTPSLQAEVTVKDEDTGTQEILAPVSMLIDAAEASPPAPEAAQKTAAADQQSTEMNEPDVPEVSMLTSDDAEAAAGTDQHSTDLYEPVPAVGAGKPCTVCDENIPLLERVECPCSHLYCFSCMNNFVRVSMNDEERFPPRCCGQAIPRPTIKAALSSDVWTKYMAKNTELRTSIRLYCHACSAFVPPTQITDDVGHCKGCAAKTCVICKKAQHVNECPKDKSTAEFLQYAQQNNWRRCPRCRTMVEKRSGCHHMSCKCGGHFCYGCGGDWLSYESHGHCYIFEDRTQPVFRNPALPRVEANGVEDQDEPRPRPFLTGPLRDLTAQPDSGGLDVSGTAGRVIIEIKDENADEAVTMPMTFQTPPPTAPVTPEFEIEPMCPAGTRFGIRFGASPPCDLCQRTNKTVTFDCNRCSLSVCELCHHWLDKALGHRSSPRKATSYTETHATWIEEMVTEGENRVQQYI